MSITHGIRLALRGLLVEADAPPVPAQAQWAWEGRRFDPAPGTPWLRERYVPSGARLIAVGAGGIVRDEWLYMIDLYFPPETPVTTLDEAGDLVMGVFRFGRWVRGPGFAGTVDVCDRASTQVRPDWLMVPISVRGHCDRDNS